MSKFISKRLEEQFKAHEENVAAICVELAQKMVHTKDNRWPQNYRYDIFGGFPGWWGQCRDAGVFFSDKYEELAEKHENNDVWIPDYWLEFVTEFAHFVWKKILKDRSPLIERDFQLCWEQTCEKVLNT